jgi:hypothetical protein
VYIVNTRLYTNTEKGGRAMRINKDLFAFVMVLLLSLAFCGYAQSEEYKAVNPSELSFGLMGFIRGGETGEGGVRILSGTFEKFLCEGKEIAVVTNKVEAGMIETRDYGKILISVTSGNLIVHLKPSQKKKLLEDMRQ